VSYSRTVLSIAWLPTHPMTDDAPCPPAFQAGQPGRQKHIQSHRGQRDTSGIL